MTGLKTKANDKDVEAFLAAIEDEGKREDAHALLKMMRRVTGAEPRMWGSSIIGFGSYHYRYASGRTGDWMLTGFSPRKANLTVYIMPGFSAFPSLMGTLGRYKTGKSCLYLKRLSDVSGSVLEALVRDSVDLMRARYECT